MSLRSPRFVFDQSNPSTVEKCRIGTIGFETTRSVAFRPRPTLRKAGGTRCTSPPLPWLPRKKRLVGLRPLRGRNSTLPGLRSLSPSGASWTPATNPPWTGATLNLVTGVAVIVVSLSSAPRGILTTIRTRPGAVRVSVPPLAALIGRGDGPRRDGLERGSQGRGRRGGHPPKHHDRSESRDERRDGAQSSDARPTPVHRRLAERSQGSFAHGLSASATQTGTLLRDLRGSEICGHATRFRSPRLPLRKLPNDASCFQRPIAGVGFEARAEAS